MDITPKDAVETKALGYGQRISAAIGIIIAMGTALLAAFGDVKWISDNLALLGTGVGALVTGGLTSYVAVRRMRVDRLAGKAGLLLLLLFPVLFLSGCLTRTRCLQQSFDGCTFNVNEPEATISDNAVPRSLQIGVQDQMVEGGTDSIASGNSTPVSTLPMGDTALEAVKGIAADYFTAGAAKAAASAANAAAAGKEAVSSAASACSDGSCAETK